MSAMLLLAAAVATACVVEPVAGSPGENHVLFHGVSPDGRTIAVGWDRGSGADVQRGAYLLDLASGKRTDLPHLNNAASFSPDGQRLVAANYAGPQLKTEIVELDLNSLESRTFASSPATEWLASYSSDGAWILFNSMRSGGSDLYRVRRSDSAIEQLSREPTYEAHAQYFDGDRKIVFHRQVAGDDYDVAVLDAETGTSAAVGATPLEESYPAISPDGRWIVFSAVATAGEQPNLYVMKADGSGRLRLTDGAAKDAYATWSPDGGTVYFVRFHEGGARIYRLGVEDGRCRPAPAERG